MLLVLAPIFLSLHSNKSDLLDTMDLVGNRRKRAKKTIITNALKDVYSHDVQMYVLPPGNEIQLSEFEELALERLQLLRILEQAFQKGHKFFSADWKECIYTDLMKHNLKKFYRLAKSSGTSFPTEADLQARRADHISHFILRLAYCRTEPLRKWFLMREIEWFKLRFSQLTPKGIESFLEINNLTYKPISDKEKAELYEELYASTSGTYIIDTVDFYKVKFCEVISLVKKRRVYVHGGFAYIPNYELVTCISGIFRTSLNEALVYASRRLPLMDDDRINFLISNLHQIYTGNDYTAHKDGAAISLENLDSYAKRHFPLCMKHIYNILKQEHGLKYLCRLHFGLFLKGIGLSFEDSMTFFHEEFTKKIDSGTFEKQYAYWVKHMYGKVGNRTSYSPYSCLSIIGSNVGPGEYHGCPYKHWDGSVLKAKLQESGMSEDYVQDIVETATKGHYQVACSKCFEHTHGQQYKTVINHPNQYFQESLNINKNSGKDKNKSNANTKQNFSNKSSTSGSSKNNASLMVNDVDWDEEM